MERSLQHDSMFISLTQYRHAMDLQTADTATADALWYAEHIKNDI